ncbi:hypothetical protein D7M11_10630 [Paenibacillus ginsengarvi]|uniref:Uncharacterized protein n=1 Tax=Paenibacillus ginsengarvi TaxID=400777 RepID=A0A3B0CIE9_9BACL|nr:hypothetical protein D7M11_10630 [Paenibacillus ginsengarvi]
MPCKANATDDKRIRLHANPALPAGPVFTTCIRKAPPRKKVQPDARIVYGNRKTFRRMLETDTGVRAPPL